MTRRALGGFGAAVLVALAIVGFVPQPALARAPSVAITSPANGAVLTQPVGIAGQAAMQNGRVDYVQISIESLEGHPVPATNTVPGNNNNNPVTFTWTPPLAYNGNYKVTALAQGTDNFDINGAEVTSVAHAFTLNVPPAAPSGVKATVNQTKRTITISWAANPEPDLTGYGVYREEGDELVERKIAKPEQTSFTDDIGSLPAGTYTYHVYAARPSAGGNGFIPSAPTKTSAKVTSSPPPTTTTTTVKGATTTTTPAPGTKPTTLATKGKADLSGFAALLPSGGARLPAARSTPAPDGGFDEDLPFGSQAESSTADEPAMDEESKQQALAAETLASSDEDEPTTLRFMAAGLLVTVVLMHMLWLREEVNREPLPAVAVNEPVEPFDE
ncbi:MAG: hypothetical protein QOG87_2945 [Actinomycetota bacterium]